MAVREETFDLATLFETSLYPDAWATAPYKTLQAELDAVRSRKKGMTASSLTRGYIENTPEFQAISRMVFDRGLMLVLDPDHRSKLPQHLQPVHAFILHPDQAWRIPAYRGLWDAVVESGGWTDAAEIQMSALLGYTAKERKIWMEQQRWRSAAWGSPTLYTLLSAEQRAHVIALGARSLGPASWLERMSFFVHAQDHAMKKTAAKLAPDGFTIARVAIERDVAAKILRHSKTRTVRRVGVISGTVSKKLAPKVIGAVRSKIELLTPTGWT